VIGTPGAAMRAVVSHAQRHGPAIPFLGVYDVFSAALAARHSEALFVSGFGFAASHYGLPDIGFITWTDMLDFVRRLRTVLPAHHLLVDIDDGYGDPAIACHVVGELERAGASGVVLEDQKRPRRCGHFDGKQLMELPEYVEKLEQVLRTRHDLFVMARTDATDPEDAARRVRAYAEAGADAVLIDGLADLELVQRLSRQLGPSFVFNQIAGGKSPVYDLAELRQAGVSLVIYSTPCLFAAQRAIERALDDLFASGGRLRSPAEGGIGVRDCTAVLQAGLERRDGPLSAATTSPFRAST
jgi:2-methylisocitrate lyase-like PEP mutase family enzyme